MPIGTYVYDLFEKSEISQCVVEKEKSVLPCPSWEMKRAHFDIECTDIKKNENPNIMVADVRSHIEHKYTNCLKVYTDGSLLDNQEAGSAFVIPALKVEKSYYIGKNRSIFTAELIAILMALNYILDLPFCIFQILLCVDSKSALYAISSPGNKKVSKIILEIKYVIHLLCLKGTLVTFCWVPSHLGFASNEWADRAAKRGARHSRESAELYIPISIQEGYHLLKEASWSKVAEVYKLMKPFIKNSLVNAHSSNNSEQRMY